MIHLKGVKPHSEDVGLEIRRQDAGALGKAKAGGKGAIGEAKQAATGMQLTKYAETVLHTRTESAENLALATNGDGVFGERRSTHTTAIESNEEEHTQKKELSSHLCIL